MKFRVGITPLRGVLGWILFAAAPAMAQTAAAPPACRDPSHGVERCARDVYVTRTSPWYGFGPEPGRWCNEVVASLRAEFPQALLHIVRDATRTSTNVRINPRYRYLCTVHVQADPIYLDKASPACR